MQFTVPNKLSSALNKRNGAFAGAILLTLGIFWEAPVSLVRVSLASDYHSHVILMPFLTAGLIYWRRQSIFSRVALDPQAGCILLLPGVILFGLSRAGAIGTSAEGSVAFSVTALLVLWVASFTLFYGRWALRSAAFPLLLVAFTIPLPVPWLDHFIGIIQRGSAEVTYVLFGLFGIPVYREGFIFILPKLNIEVSKQCSGIHSTMALLILSLMAGYIFLRARLKQALLVASIVPIVCATNGLRIAVLTTLAIYVDERIILSAFHRHGGAIFFLLGIGLMTPVLYLLRRSEGKSSGKAAGSPASS